jgi:cell wall-associated NlpC family hydrolase
VYEVYKVGQDVERLDGLDILSSIGINAAVIPHYDNAEGGNHDTRFCYLGQARLEMFETMLDNDTYVLGVDEHTGLVIDIDAQEATVVGNGGVTLRLRSQSFVYPTGSVLPFSLLQNPFQLLDPGSSATSTKTARIASTETQVHDAQTNSVSSSLEQSLQHTSQEFEEAMKHRDAEGAVRAALALEQAMVDWKADTLQGDVTDRCRATLRSMMSQLGDAAVSGVRDPRDVVSPYIEAMLAVRAIVRAEKRFDLSDIIRDAFASLNIEVRDTPQGAEWSLPTE